jgi:hypothetical protein
MPKTATPESQKSGFLKKLYGIWSAIDFNFRRLILHLRLWKWAAVHHPNFWQFEISFTQIIRSNISTYPTAFEFLSITIAFSRPFLYLFESPLAVSEFCSTHGINMSYFD